MKLEIRTVVKQLLRSTALFTKYPGYRYHSKPLCVLSFFSFYMRIWGPYILIWYFNLEVFLVFCINKVCFTH
jgi:hypothetical protein